MKHPLVVLLGASAFLVQSLSAQSVTNVINSWENSSEGWGTDGANWSSGGFSTTTGVTQGTYSWILNAAGSPGYGFAIGSTASTAITVDLANATAVKIDVLATGFSYQQWDLTLNSSAFTVPLGGSYQSADGYSFPQSPVIGTETTLTWTIPASMQAILAANPTMTTSLNFQIGGGNAGTMYIDNLRIIDPATPAPEPATFAMMGAGVAGLLAFRRRKI